MDHLDILIRLAFAEDLGFPAFGSEISPTADITTTACISETAQGSAVIIAKEHGILAGQWVARRVFELLDDRIRFEEVIPDGSVVSPGLVLAKIQGPYRSILVGERTALNFMQRLSGVATTTKKVSTLVAPYSIKILDTRKTTPGYRILEKKAVQLGGGTNHRMGLYDEFLIKNNHIDALGGDVARAVRICRAYKPDVNLKVEVRNWDEIEAALGEKPDGLLLDNFTPAELNDVILKIRLHPNGGALRLEASGGITPSNVEGYARTGINEVSLGFLTHAIKSLDLSLRYTETR